MVYGTSNPDWSGLAVAELEARISLDYAREDFEQGTKFLEYSLERLEECDPEDEGIWSEQVLEAEREYENASWLLEERKGNLITVLEQKNRAIEASCPI